MMLRLITLTTLLVACGSKSKDPATACADAAKRGIDAMINQARGRLAASQLPEDIRAQMLERQKRLESAGSKMRAVFTNRCVDDKWTTAVLGCYMKVSSLEDMRACRKQLTAEQQAKLQKDELELLAGTSGPPGFDQSQPGGVLRAPKDPRIDFVDRAINDARKLVADAKTPDEDKAAREQLAALEGEKTQLEGQIASTTTPEAMAALEKEVADAKAKLDSVEKDHKRSDKDRSIASADYFRALQELESAKKRQQITELAAKLDDLNARIAVAAGRVTTDHSEATRDAAKAALEALRAEHEKLKAEFQTAMGAKP